MQPTPDPHTLQNPLAYTNTVLIIILCLNTLPNTLDLSAEQKS